MIDLFLHLDTHLQNVITTYGVLTYVILFLIIFCETGLIVTPFLPGDSLLFASGAFAGMGDLNLLVLFVLLSFAALLGNIVNYHVGRLLGERVFKDTNRILRRSYLLRTHAFYATYGAKTIVLSRFVPIIRTVAPFVAGAGTMSPQTFHTYNLIGGVSWVGLFIFGGYFFGNIPFVQEHFTTVIMAIIVLSLVPPIVSYIREMRTRARRS